MARWTMLALGLVGCGEGAWRAEVWSEDGARRASVRQDWSCGSGLFGSSCQEDGAPWLVVDGWELGVDRTPEFGSDELYYMRGVGYVLYPVLVRDYDAPDLVWASVVDADSGEELWTPGRHSVPSTDGELVATPRVTETDAGRTFVWVSFHDARSGRVVDETAELRVFENVDDWNPPALTWVGDREIRVDMPFEPLGAVVGGDLEPADAPDCWLPRTSSSAWNADGENAYADFNWAGDGRRGRCPDGG